MSLKVHGEGMTVEKAAKFLRENAYYSYLMAQHEATRGTYDPGYLTYASVQRQILKLRDSHRKQEGDAF